MASRQRKVTQRRRRRRNLQREKSRETLRLEQRLASDAHPIHACMVNRHWREEGKASIHMARRVGPGRVTMASFLVDTWAMGLKDAFGRIDIPTSEFDEVVERLDEQLGTEPLNLGTAKHVVFGGIELARELGFRLPRRYERWTAVLGPLPDGESPDMSLFRCDGMIRLVCSGKDLEARLIGTTPENFLRRRDVEFILADDDFTLVDEAADGANDAVTMLENAMLDRVKAWCFANGQTPHPRLREVIEAMLEGIVQSVPPDFTSDDDFCALSEDQRTEATMQTMSFVSASLHHDPAGLQGAMAQFDAFMHDMGSPEELIETLGLDDEQ